MKRIRVDNHIERRMLIGLVTSSDYFRQARKMISPELMEIPYAQTVVQWCSEYFNEFHVAPGRHIEDIFHEKKKEILDTDERDLVRDFLASLSDEYEVGDKLNVPYLLEQTERRLNLRKLTLLQEQIQEAIETEDASTAETLIREHKNITKEIDPSFNPFDKEEIIAAFEQQGTPLMTFGGALGNMLNEHLVRDSFIALMGPEKRGKTWWLYEFALQGFRCRNNVALFEAGDLSKQQAIRRMHARLSGKSYMKSSTGIIRKPVAVEKSDAEGLLIPGHEIVYEEVLISEPLDAHQAVKTTRRFLSRTKGKKFKIASYGHDLTIEEMNRVLDKWEEEEGFVPDIIVTDYADIVDVEDHRLDERGRENKKWAGFRALSEKRHCLYITATQADAASYGIRSVGMKNFSIDKRKLAHVTGLIGLNQTEEEKEAGVMRLGWVVLREGEALSSKEVYVLQCLQMGRPYITSFTI